MDYLITIISKFEGILGAVLGSVATLIATNLIKSLGKIKFYFYDYEIKYYGENEIGEISIINDQSKAEYCSYKVRMQVYNSSEVVKPLKDFQIEFKSDDKAIYSKPKNNGETIDHGVYYEYKDFNLINILPKHLTEINLTGMITKQDMKYFSKVNEIYFIAKDYKNKKIKQLIKKF
ncbi:hypothetical protein RSJ22_12105 [Clostridium botulinum]|uniref:hypothetical protein n=1 Tax=Clostridium botulinum TaxID=1491 RepID=UPI00046680D8|nr:hypothetical protein [Clostridium botulinum]APQ73946.1 hypothetical protein RSJ9_2683 [Clostridium botulinum]AUM99597.1 hypothetical protein RSJ13_11515 [Clostridium botulinum]AUN22143.1 hypothetical protein RSJ22_12105 [Clostridium botulinum]NFB55907.1 hypothetical protein [Clostridium botulinum]NFB59820.1 hypothetical protein [Clostridium botulinum]